MSSIYSLPSSVMLQILHFLTWDERMNLVKGIQQCQDILFSRSAWHNLYYDYDVVVHDSDVDSFGTKFVDCIERYGASFEDMKLAFTTEKQVLILDILKKIREKCCNLSTLKLEHFCFNNKNEFEEGYFFTFSTAFCDILQNWQQLKNVKIGPVSLSEYICGLEILLSMIIEKNHAHKITEVDFLLASSYNNMDYNHFVLSFHNLKTLAIKIEYLSAETLLNVVGKSLTTLALYTDDETEDTNNELNYDVWKTVLSKQPLFKVELEIRQKEITFSDLPRSMPLTKLALTFFRTDIELNRLISYITESYSKNLTMFQFIFDDSGEDEGLQFNEITKQVSYALVDMIRESPKLEILKYSLPISSYTVLRIAKEKRLKEFCVYENRIYYVNDDKWSGDESLKGLGTDRITLEENVSVIINKKWTVTPDEEYEIFNH